MILEQVSATVSGFNKASENSTEKTSNRQTRGWGDPTNQNNIPKYTSAQQAYSNSATLFKLHLWFHE